jgi:5-methylcytosine-specific restriction endonuclease McrA
MLESVTFWGSLLALILPWIGVWLWGRLAQSSSVDSPKPVPEPRPIEPFEIDLSWEPTWDGGEPEWLRNSPPVTCPLSHYELRRWRMEENGGSHTRQEWQALCAQFNGRCPRCKRKRRLTKDHIVPVVRGGSDDISNIQPLCKSCNSSKHDKIADYRPRHLRVRSE